MRIKQPGPDAQTLTTACVEICFAELAYLRVDSVSPRYISAGLMVASMEVLALPQSDSLSSQVSVDSRKGMTTGAGALGGAGAPAAERCCAALCEEAEPAAAACLASAEMHLPSVDSDLLMLAPSFRRAPVAPVALARSDPARSTRESFDSRTFLRRKTNTYLDVRHMACCCANRCNANTNMKYMT
jgi:hypothetical protein